MMMTDEQTHFVTKTNEAIRECESFLFITRCSDLQRTAMEAIVQTAEDIKREKERAVRNGNERYANILLGLQCAVGALVAEILMYLALKDEDPDAAWDHLVEAQNALAAAARADAGFSHCAMRYERLNVIERTIFPPQAFLSAGAIVTQAECSICNEDYNDCDHVMACPYMGEFCSVVVRRADLDHVASVDHPADKRCRVITQSTEGGSQNWMTLRRDGRVGESGSTT